VYLPMVDEFCEMPLIVAALAWLIPNARVAIRHVAKIYVILFIATYPLFGSSRYECGVSSPIILQYHYTLKKGGKSRAFFAGIALFTLKFAVFRAFKSSENLNNRI
jgi:hypothetical protein